MAMPKLNKQTISAFFLYHTEKLIIALAIALMGFFFWKGYKTEVFDDKSPTELSRLADQAGQHILSPTSWESIKDFRQADSNAPTEIKEGEGRVSASDYPVGPTSVIVKSLEPRKDPKLHPATEMVAESFTAPIFFRTGKSKSPYDDLDYAVNAGEDPPKKRDRKDKPEPAKVPGDALPLVQHHEMHGVRPPTARLNQSDNPFLIDGVAVKGLVEVKKQHKDYKRAFEFGAGYFPERDQPIYNYVQVERAEVRDGQIGDWKDISDRLWEGQTKLYPSTAREVVHHDYFDSVLTGTIPPLAMIDYTPLALHPKTGKRKFPDLDEASALAEGPENPDELFDGSNVVEDPRGRRSGRRVETRGRIQRRQTGNQMGGMIDRNKKVARRAGNDPNLYQDDLDGEEPEVDHKLVRFFDLKTVPGRTYQYRIRLWVSDPNNDLDEAIKAGKAQRRPAAGAAMGGGMDDMMMDDMMMDDMMMDDSIGMDDMMGMDRSMGGGSAMELGPDGKPKKVFKKIPITNKMLSPETRSRIAKTREEVDPKDPNQIIYYVTEFRKDENGETVEEEIQVPKGWDDLRFSRPTPWSEPVEVTVRPSRSFVAAGGVEPPRTVRVGNQEVPDGEPVADLVAGYWSQRYKTLVPARRRAHRADVMNFVADSFLMNPISWVIHWAQQHEIKTDVMVVDVMGGTPLEASRSEMLDYKLPGEVLVMKQNGKFELHADYRDKTKFRHALFIHDETATVGEEKKPEANNRRGRRR